MNELGLEGLGTVERGRRILDHFGKGAYGISSGPWLQTLSAGPTPLGGIGLSIVSTVTGYYGWPNTEFGISENFKNCECQ